MSWRPAEAGRPGSHTTFEYVDTRDTRRTRCKRTSNRSSAPHTAWCALWSFVVVPVAAGIVSAFVCVGVRGDAWELVVALGAAVCLGGGAVLALGMFMCATALLISLILVARATVTHLRNISNTFAVYGDRMLAIRVRSDLMPPIRSTTSGTSPAIP